MSKHRIAVLTAAALLTGTAGAAAQACLGQPTRDGDIAVAGSFAPSDDGSLVGGGFHTDVTGPASFGFSYRTGTSDDAASTYEARVAYDLYLLEPAICGVAGVRFTDRSSAGDPERLAVPIGLGVGKAMRVDRLAAIVYAIPQYMWVREDRSTVGVEEVETSSEFTAETGLTLGLDPVFLNAALLLDTLDDDPAFRLRLGLVF